MFEPQEVILPLPHGTGSVSAVRSTLILSSIHTLQGRGFYDRYVEALPAMYHDARKV